MSVRFVLGHVVVFAGLAGLVAAASPRRNEAAILPAGAETATLQSGGLDLQELETRAALDPTAESTRALASRYLDFGQPGLAAAAIERVSSEIQGDLAVAEVHGRALYALGKAERALEVVLTAQANASPDAPAWLTAKVDRQATFLRELVAAGVEDPALHPEETQTAYHRTSREVRLVAIR